MLKAFEVSGESGQTCRSLCCSLMCKVLKFCALGHLLDDAYYVIVGRHILIQLLMQFCDRFYYSDRFILFKNK